MERKLINYLPYEPRNFAEFQGITTGEQPEFELVWDCEQEVFDNQFIDTAQDYGLSRWEKMLKIFPKGTDTLETRRARIKTKLNNFVPYSFRVFIHMLTAIANGDPFSVSIEVGSYLLKIETQWGASGQMEGLEYLIKEIVPCNIALNVENRLLCISEGVALAIGGVCAVNTFFITNDSRERMETSGEAMTRGGIVHAICPFVTNDSKETFTTDGAATLAGGIVDSATVVITNDFNEQFKIAGTSLTGGGNGQS